MKQILFIIARHSSQLDSRGDRASRLYPMPLLHTWPGMRKNEKTSIMATLRSWVSISTTLYLVPDISMTEPSDVSIHGISGGKGMDVSGRPCWPAALYAASLTHHARSEAYGSAHRSLCPSDRKCVATRPSVTNRSSLSQSIPSLIP